MGNRPSSARTRINLILGITSPDARWGIFAILVSFWISFWAFALSFYQLADRGGVGMLIMAWVFAIVGLLFLVLALSFGWYWCKHPHIDITPDILRELANINKELANIKASIVNLTSEIRQEKDERNKSSGEPFQSVL